MTDASQNQNVIKAEGTPFLRDSPHFPYFEAAYVLPVHQLSYKRVPHIIVLALRYTWQVRWLDGCLDNQPFLLGCEQSIRCGSLSHKML